MKEFSIERKWSLIESWYPALFRKPAPLTTYDKVLLELLRQNDGVIEKNKLGQILGLGMKNDKPKNIYKDPAEIKILEVLLKELQKYHLIKMACEVSTREEQVLLDYWGNRALEDGRKYSFHEGLFPTYDHLYLRYEESSEFFFPFFKLPIDFHIKEEKPAYSYFLEQEITGEAIFVLKKIKFNQKGTDSAEDYLIDIVTPTRKSVSEKVTTVTINLLDDGEEASVTLSIDDVGLPEFDNILKDPINAGVYEDVLLFAEYNAILTIADRIGAKELAKYRAYVDWATIIEDERIEWTESLFELLSESDISNGSLWKKVTSLCPRELLLSNLDSYKNFLNWISLSKIFEVDHIIDSYSLYPWDTDVLVERADSKQIEKWLSNYPEESENLDWTVASDKISDAFIEANLSRINFDLRFITKERKDLCKKLLLNHPSLQLDWKVVSAEYELSFLLENIGAFREFLDLTLLIPRILNEPDTVLNDFLYDQAFKDLLERFSNLKNRHFYINASSNVSLDKLRIEFLDKYKLAFWGAGSIAGIEVNKNLTWSEENFFSFKDKIRSDSGKKVVSQSIPSIEIVKENPDFDWNFFILSQRDKFLNDFRFIESHKKYLFFDKVLFSISSELLQEELLFFKEWGESSGRIKEFIHSLESRFDLLTLMTLISIYELQQFEFDWINIIDRSSIEDAGKSFIVNHKLINDLINSALFVESITKKLNEAFILENNDLAWDWKLVTTKKLSSENLREERVLTENARNLYWPYIIREIFTVNELVIEERLPEIAAYLSVASEFIERKSWTAITEKLPTYELWKAIAATDGKELFKWDWGLISSTEKILDNFSFDNLLKIQSLINWGKLSQNPLLNHIWNYSKNSFIGYNDWRDYVLGYLVPFQNYWDFKLLSKIGSITWSPDIVNWFIDEWDWDVLSKESKLLTRAKDGEIRYEIRNLKRYGTKINWEILSERYEVAISEKEFAQFLEKDWNFQSLSSHLKLSLSFALLKQTLNENWDWKSLTRRKDLKLNKSLLLAQKIEEGEIKDIEEWKWIKNIDWDWKYLSKEKYLDGELLKAFHDKEWDWKAISENQSILFDLSLLQLLTTKEDVNWSAIITNTKTHINSNTLRVLESTTSLSNEDWKLISTHPNLNIYNIEESGLINFEWDFIDRYVNFWDWNLLVSKKMIDVFNIAFLKRYQNWLDWGQISTIPSIESRGDILEEFTNKLDWNAISKKISPSIEILLQFQDYLNWDLVSNNTSIKFAPDLISMFEKKWNYYLLKENIALKESDEARGYLEGYLSKHKEFEFYFLLMAQYSKWAGNVYHFTHLTNALEIIKSKKILSRNKAKDFADAAGSVVGRRDTAHDFARFYFRPQTPTQFYNECLGKDINSGYEKSWKYWTPETDWVHNSKWVTYFPQARRLGLPKCPIPVFFKFDIQEVLLHFSEKCFASTGNMQTNWANFYPISEVLPYFHYNDVYSTIDNTSDGNWRTYIDYSQQEFLVKDEFDFTSLTKFLIIVRTEEDKQQLLNSIEKGNPIRNKIFVDSYGYDIFHNENCKIYYSFDGKKLSINSDYQGDGISSGRFFIEIGKNTRYDVKSGDILQIVKNCITAYPSIDIVFSGSPTFSVKFIDESNREWLILEERNETDGELIQESIHSIFLDYQPSVAILFFKERYSNLRSFYETKVRHYSLENHTLLVANQFEKFFSGIWNNTYETSIDINLFRCFLLLHDIGKPKAEASGNRKNQYQYSSEIIKEIWEDLPFSDKQLDLVLGLLKGDPIGEYFQNLTTLDECFSKIISANDRTGVGIEGFFNLFMVYYQCDIAAYTKDAGGYSFLENLFIYENGEKQFDGNERLLKFAKPYDDLYLELKIKILKYANQVY